MRKLIALLALATVSPAFADDLPGLNFKIDASMLDFTYQPNESAGLPCKHTLVNPASQDWDVICQSADGKESHRYGVHLWVTTYPRDVEPKVSYEVLYWVDDRSEKSSSHGSTIWFHLKDQSAIQKIEVGQFVDNGSSSLDMDLTVKKK